MKKVEKTEVLGRISKLLANHSLPDNKLQDIAAAISEKQIPVIGVDICTIGICMDITHTGSISDIDLSSFVDDRLGPIKSIEVFPEGIVLPDAARIRITHAL